MLTNLVQDADNFPQIVVLGVQSSGKSSILEMIVGEGKDIKN